jgi:hypothetical protein
MTAGPAGYLQRPGDAIGIFRSQACSEPRVGIDGGPYGSETRSGTIFGNGQ